MKKLDLALDKVTFERLCNREDSRHKKAINKLKKLNEDFQKVCKHTNTTYYPDPSGNHDSETQCNVCGKVL